MSAPVRAKRATLRAGGSAPLWRRGWGGRWPGVSSWSASPLSRRVSSAGAQGGAAGRRSSGSAVRSSRSAVPTGCVIVAGVGDELLFVGVGPVALGEYAGSRVVGTRISSSVEVPQRRNGVGAAAWWSVFTPPRGIRSTAGAAAEQVGGHRGDDEHDLQGWSPIPGPDAVMSSVSPRSAPSGSVS